MSISDELLQKKIEEIQAQVQDTKVVAVTKYVDADQIERLYDQGLRLFGENRADELLDKQAALKETCSDIEWHFIGRLQRRPVKDIINQIDYLHSLDRMNLVKEVNKRADHPIKCFLQVNVSQEEQKAGFAVEEVRPAIEAIADYPNIRIVGLMTMAPYEADEAALAHIFSTLKNCQEDIERLELAYAPCHELSMGMSRDFPIAIDHGATYVRIGRAFFQE